MRDWLSFWNAPNRIYVNDHHRDVHYRDVALQIRSLVPSPSATVIDYGCGEATAAHMVAEAAGRLILSDGAPVVRRSSPQASPPLNPKITVLSPQEIAALPAASVDLHRDEFGRPISQARTELDALLAPCSAACSRPAAVWWSETSSRRIPAR